MASITIRNLDDDIKHLLRVRAAEHGSSMEEEARDILRRVMGEIAPPRNLAAAILIYPPVNQCIRRRNSVGGGDDRPRWQWGGPQQWRGADKTKSPDPFESFDSCDSSGCLAFDA